jgi:hypothetical protein
LVCFAYALLSMARHIVQPIFVLERKGDQRDDLSDGRLYLAEQNPDLRVQGARADTSAMMKVQRGGPPWFAAAIIEHERTPQ